LVYSAKLISQFSVCLN